MPKTREFNALANNCSRVTSRFFVSGRKRIAYKYEEVVCCFKRKFWSSTPSEKHSNTCFSEEISTQARTAWRIKKWRSCLKQANQLAALCPKSSSELLVHWKVWEPEAQNFWMWISTELCVCASSDFDCGLNNAFEIAETAIRKMKIKILLNHFLFEFDLFTAAKL